MISMRIQRKIREFRAMITVEPCIAFFLVAMSVTTIANQNLLLDKTCRVNLGHSAEICDALIARDLENSTIVDIDLEVQKFVTHLNSMGKLVQVFIPFVLVLFWGLWSDRHHLRKPLIVIPLFGEVMKNLCLIMCVYFDSTTAQVAFLVENIFPLVFGNWIIIVIGVFSHVIDTTTVENRTTKVAFNNVFVTLGDPIGSSLSGVLLRETGYYGVFTLSAVLTFVGMLFCIYGVEESPRPVAAAAAVTEKELKAEGRELAAIEMPRKEESLCSLFVDFFNFKDLKSIFSVFTRQRTDKKRPMLFLLYLLLLFGFGPMYGNYSVSYLFMRHKFNFSEIDYSIYCTLTSIMGTAGLVIIMLVNTKLLRANDFGLAIIGMCFGIAASVAFAFSRVSRDLYIAAAIESGLSVFGVSVRSALMKMVDPDESAKSNAIIGAFEGTIFLLHGTIYNFIYNQTINTFASAFYFVSTGCYVISLGISCALFCIYRSVVRGQAKVAASQTTLESNIVEKF